MSFGDIWDYLGGSGDAKPPNVDFIAEFGTKKVLFFDSIVN